MTRNEAEQLNAQIIEYLGEYSQILGIESDFAFNVVDDYLEVIPETQKKDIVFLGKSARSIKPGNIKIDLKGLIMAAIELTSSIGVPDNLFELIQVVLQGCIFIFKVTEVKLGKEEAEVVYVLHELGAYCNEVEESRIKEELRRMLKIGRIENFDLDRFDERVNNLLKIHVIDMTDGRIMLKEHVWGKL